MNMDLFFEAWVECVLEFVALHVGGVLRRGRRAETVTALRWDPPFHGAQVSLVPDLLLEAPHFTLIADAKYKRHLEEMVATRGQDPASLSRQEHRHDMFQVPAYSHLARTERSIALLAYPCSADTRESLTARRRQVQRASIPFPNRDFELWLAALPMKCEVQEAAAPLIALLRTRWG